VLDDRGEVGGVGIRMIELPPPRLPLVFDVFLHESELTPVGFREAFASGHPFIPHGLVHKPKDATDPDDDDREQ
jgi:hypothetical protein